MQFYYDFENAKNRGMKGIDRLSESDCVLIFHAPNQSLSFNCLNRILESKATIRCFTVDTGRPEALDFQLITQLLLDWSLAGKYYIVAQDKGYDMVIRQLLRNGKTNVARIPSIAAWVAGEQYLSELMTTTKGIPQNDEALHNIKSDNLTKVDPEDEDPQSRIHVFLPIDADSRKARLKLWFRCIRAFGLSSGTKFFKTLNKNTIDAVS